MKAKIIKAIAEQVYACPNCIPEITGEIKICQKHKRKIKEEAEKCKVQ